MTDSLRVYVAGGSDSMPRVQHAVARLRALGITIASTWLDVVTATPGGANPRDASEETRAGWSQTDLNEVAGADLLWFLTPSPGVTRGAWVELGYALATGKTAVCSGDTKQSVFCALAHEFGTDDEAIDFIVKYAGCRTLIGRVQKATP